MHFSIFVQKFEKSTMISIKKELQLENTQYNNIQNVSLEK
jgi:hypothetical protein